MSAANKRPNERGTALHEMAGLYAPQGVDLGGGGSPSTIGMTQCVTVAWQRNNCKGPSIMLGIP